ncbi:MAG: YopX family protein [Acutalibacteraceae bacterium]|nr:YopX family protein [Acutalibacteraceae bacterium]
MQNREILFRGQTRRYGEKLKNVAGEPMESNWVYGGIFPNNFGSDFAIIYQQEPDIKKFSVYADTVCQYTGLTDVYGTMIFEGDIVSFYDCLNSENGYSEQYCCGVVVWDKETLSFQVTNRLSAESYEVLSECSVIGNKFDNPNLLKV